MYAVPLNFKHTRTYNSGNDSYSKLPQQRETSKAQRACWSCCTPSTFIALTLAPPKSFPLPISSQQSPLPLVARHSSSSSSRALGFPCSSSSHSASSTSLRTTFPHLLSTPEL